MKRTSLIKSVGAAGVAAGAVLAVCLAPAATAAQPIENAMQRDMGLSAQQVQTRLAQEATAMKAAPAAKAAAGEALGGSWYDAATGKLVVGITDAAKADAVHAAGADTVQVANTEASLNAAKKSIDDFAGKTAPKDVAGWYVDQKANTIVVDVKQGAASPEVTQFLNRAKASGPVRVDTVNAAPRLYAGNVVGGDAYYINGSARCSVGFSVSDGFVSAGHCGNSGDSVTDANGADMGTFDASSFPGNDYSHVKTNSDFTPSATVDGYGNGDVTVSGSNEAAVGESVCRSGSTSGWHCGTIQATNQTVNYSEGTVEGLTKTDACAEPGDSGGSWVSGTEAQGVTSGGSGDCTSGGTTYFQPVNEILQAYGLTLVTG